MFPQHSQHGRQRGRGQDCLGRGFLWGESLECSVMSALLWRGGRSPTGERTFMLLGDTGMRGGWQPSWCSWAERSTGSLVVLYSGGQPPGRGPRGVRGHSWGEAAPGPWERRCWLPPRAPVPRPLSASKPPGAPKTTTSRSEPQSALHSH